MLSPPLQDRDHKQLHTGLGPVYSSHACILQLEPGVRWRILLFPSLSLDFPCLPLNSCLFAFSLCFPSSSPGMGGESGRGCGPMDISLAL